MKKKLVIVAVIALLAVAALATVAYFSAQDTATNVITTGNVTMKLHEYQMIDGEKSPYPKDAVAAMPGTVISKIPTIENTGNNDFYTRAKVSVAFYADKDMKELVNLDTKICDLRYHQRVDRWWRRLVLLQRHCKTRPERGAFQHRFL